MTGDDVTLDDLRKRLNGIDRQLLELVAERKAREPRSRPREAHRRPPDARLRARARSHPRRARDRARSSAYRRRLAEELLRMLIRSSLTTQEKASVVGGRRGVGPPGAGHRRRRHDGPVVRGVSRLAGLCCRGRRSGGRARRRHRARRLAQFRSQARLHRARHTHSALTDAHPARPGPAPAARRDFRHRVAQVAVALGSRCAAARTAARSPRCIRCSGRIPSCCPAATSSSWILAATKRCSGPRELFAPTMAEQVVMSLDEHDRLIAYVLGLSHALNIAFFTALAESGEAAPRLARLSSTTFDAQLDIASRVAQENAGPVFRDPGLNDYGAESLEALSKAVERLRTRGAFAGSRSFCCVNAPRARLSRGPPHGYRTAGLSR